MIKLIFGLGNPGLRYRLTRHNIGHLVVERFVEAKVKKFRKLFNSEIAIINSVKVVKCLSFVNSSGNELRMFVEKFKLENQELLIICDDFAIPFGSMRFRLKGSSGGHKGLTSIIEALGTTEFPRLRIGIGPLPNDINAKDFVLSEFNDEEKKKLKEIIDNACKGIELILNSNPNSSMQVINRKA